MDRILEGTEQVLVLDGVVDRAALRSELMTEQQLLSVVHRQGFDGFSEVKKCVLEPNGSFYIEGRKPTADEIHHGDIVARLEQIQRDLAQIQKQLPAG
jgi:uncharacterized membrane protein YcaP (DUF421 family)